MGPGEFGRRFDDGCTECAAPRGQDVPIPMRNPCHGIDSSVRVVFPRLASTEFTGSRAEPIDESTSRSPAAAANRQRPSDRRARRNFAEASRRFPSISSPGSLGCGPGACPRLLADRKYCHGLGRLFDVQLATSDRGKVCHRLVESTKLSASGQSGLLHR